PLHPGGVQAASDPLQLDAACDAGVLQVEALEAQFFGQRNVEGLEWISRQIEILDAGLSAENLRAERAQLVVGEDEIGQLRVLRESAAVHELDLIAREVDFLH